MSITLEEAKYYLRIDDPIEPELDLELQAMIDAAIRYLEDKTNWVWFPRDKRYFATSDDGCGGDTRIYDFPINSITGGFPEEEKNGYTLVHTRGAIITANVGFADSNDIPAPLKQAALQLIKYFYYESEKTLNTEMIPDGVRRTIDLYKRFIL